MQKAQACHTARAFYKLKGVSLTCLDLGEVWSTLPEHLLLGQIYHANIVRIYVLTVCVCVCGACGVLSMSPTCSLQFTTHHSTQ